MSSSPVKEIALTVTMLSDWHIGIGAGRQLSVDRLVARDEDGLPYIPASTIRGIWRDAAETLALGLDDGQKGAWSAYLDDLFGTQIGPTPPDDAALIVAPRAGALVCGSLHIEPSLRAGLVGPEHQARRDALTHVKPGVEIDVASGMAKDDHLRFEEVAMGGLVLAGNAWLDGAKLPTDGADVATDLLITAAAMIERLGAKRRRGLGRCKVEAKSGDASFKAEMIDRLEKATPPAVITDKRDAEDLSKPSYGKKGADETEWHSREIVVELLSPLIIPDEVLGNVVTTQHTIPGSYLLPMVAKAAERAGVVDVFSLISTGNLQVLPATPEIAGQRGLPVPLCWERPKDKSVDQKLRSILVHHDGGVQHTPLRRGFITLDTTSITNLEEPKLQLTTHNVIEDETQRPTEAVGGVYSYEALASGQRFRSVIRMRSARDALDRVANAMDGSIHWLGRGKPGGYGRVRIEVGDPVKDPQSNAEPVTILYVWLTSDLLLRDKFLEAVTTPQAVATHLVSALGAALTIKRHSFRTRRIESWQSRWGLPRPSLVAVQAGSVLRLKVWPEIDRQKLRRLEAEGLGERRAEGFGQVRFIVPELSAPSELKEAETQPARTSAAPTDGAGRSEVLATIDAVVKQRAASTAAPAAPASAVGAST